MTSSTANSEHGIHKASASIPSAIDGSLDLHTIHQALTEYGDSILRLTFSYVHDLHDAEDILQDTLAQYIKQDPKLESASQLKVWLLRAAITISKSKLKERMYDPEHNWSQFILDPYTAENLAFVWDAVSKLRFRYSEIVHLYYYEGYNLAEIAMLLDQHSSSVNTRLYRARAQLKKRLREDYDFDPIEHNAYRQLLDHITVTSEMKERLLKALQQEEQQEIKRIDIKPYYIYRRQRFVLISIASCAVSAMCSTLLMLYPADFASYKGPAGFQPVSVYPVMSYTSLEELNKSLPFPLRISTALANEYTLRFKYILFAQAVSLTYSDGSTRIEYKMIQDDMDITGDTSHFTDIIKLIGTDKKLITLKGDAGLYKIALWTDGTYTYSIKSSIPLTKEVFLRWVESTTLYPDPPHDEEVIAHLHPF